MDKTTEIYALPEDRSAAEPAAYTLYPDAGDFAGLDTPAPLPEPPQSLPAPFSVPSASPSASPVPPKPAAGSVPVPAAAKSASVTSVPRPRFLFRLLCIFLVLSALAVYGNLLLSGGTSLLAKGLDTLALQNIFGLSRDVTIIPQAAETGSGSAEAGTVTETTPSSPDTAPPASEQPVPAVDAAILSMDLSSDAPAALGMINETPYTPDLTVLAERAPVIDNYAALESFYGKNCPAVLILHTHGTEAFADQADAGYHTDDRQRNICTVGRALADTLTDSGIGVIHCTELFDAESFDMAYYNAARYIRQTLEENPSIRYILDIHRDAITTGDGTGIRPLSVQNGVEYAQLMFVVGTDHGGSGHKDWENNLSIAARLQSALHSENPTLMRDINLRSASFNAQYAPGALLLEAGAAASALEEAVRSIEVFGEALAKEILGK